MADKDFSFLMGQQRVDLFNKPAIDHRMTKVDSLENEAPPEIGKKRSHRRRRVKRKPRLGRDTR